MEEEFAPDAGADVVDNRPLEERIGDKNWKTRLGAYDDLKKLIAAPVDERPSTLYSDYAQWLTKMTADINAAALDSGLDTALVFVDSAPSGSCTSYYDKLFSNIVDKTFGASRASTITKGKALMHKMMEVDETSACVTFLLTKLADKKPKIPPTCLDIIKEGIEFYGIKAFPIKDIVKALPTVFNGTNSGARDSAMALCVEIYRWIRLPPLQSMLDGLRTAQKSEFEKIIAEKSPEFTSITPEPTLYLRKERPSEEAIAAKAAAAAERAASGAPVSAAVPEGADGREYVEEVDLMKKLKNTEYSTLIAEEKWSEQLKGLQLVIDAIGPVPKIKPGNDVHDLIQTIKSFLRQGHLQLQVSSLKILCLLADGLRKEFGSVLRPIMQQVIQKSKEKRLVIEVQAVLNIAFLHCLTYDSCADDILEFVSSKKSPPHGKIGLLEVVVKTFTTLADKVSSDALKPLATALITECDDADPKVREAAVNALASIVILAKSRGRLAGDVTKVISNLETANAKVHKKVMTAVETIASGGSAANASADPLTESLKSKSSVSSGLVKKLSATSNVAAPASVPRAGGTVSLNATTGTVGIKKASAPAPAAASSAAPSTKRAASSAPAEDDQMEDIALSLEEAIVQLEPMQIPGWTETGLALMESTKWQDKVEALGVIETRLNELAELGGAASYSAALIKYIASTSGNFKISNNNILKATIQTCTALVKQSNPAVNNAGGKFSRAAGWELVKNLGDKLSDKKNKDVVQGLLTALAETCSPTFVIKRMKAVLDKCISPAAHQYYLEWLKDCIAEFGCHNVPIPFVCTVCQSEIENKNAAVRTAAVECVGGLYNQVGPRLTAIAISDDMKAQVKALLEAEFAKVGYDPNAASSAPKAHLVAGGAASGGSGGASGGSASSAADGAIPRQNLCNMVDKNILTELAFTDSKNSWERRKAAMESIISACERSAHYLEANKPTGEIVKALKPRMTDTQANLKPVAVTCIGHVIASLNSTSGAKVLATMASAMCIGLADNKKSMRDSTILALQHAVSGACPAAVAIESDASMSAFAAADTGMLMATIPAAGESLMNIVGRLELLLFLNHHVLSLKGDLSELVKPLVETLQDKSAAVRSTGEALLTALLAHSLTTKSVLDKHTRDLPPATKRAMQASIDRMMAAYGTAPARPVAAAAPAVPATPAAATPAPPQNKSRAEPVIREEAEPVAEVRVPGKKAPVVVDSPPTPPRATTASAAMQNSPPLPAQASRTTAAEPVLPPTPPHIPVAAASATNTASPTAWLLRRNLAGKLRRTEQTTLSWPQPPDAPSDTEIAALKVVWRPIVTPDLAFLLFPIVRPGSPVNQDIYVPAMNELSTQLTCPYLTHHTEFLLRWICIVLCLKHESSPGLLRLLQLVCDLFESIDAENKANANSETATCALTEAEVMCILPHLIDRAGHKSERHAQLIVYAITLMCSLTPPKNIMHYLSQGLHSHNKRSRVVCLEEMSRMVEMYNTAVVTAPVVHSVVAYLDSRDCDITARNACLDVLVQVYGALHNDLPKLKKMIGNDVSERTMAMIEEKLGVTPAVPAAVATPVHTGHSVARTPAVKSAAKAHTPAAATPAAAVASHSKVSPGPTIDTSNSSEAWGIQADASMVSPNTEQRTNKILLEQIDSVMASTPLPAHRKKSDSPFESSASAAEEAVSDAAEAAYASPVHAHVSQVSTPLTKQSVHSPLTTHSAAAPGTAVAPTPAENVPQTAQSARSTASVDAYEQHDTISALPVEFRSPVTSPVVQKFKNRMSMSGIKKEQGEDNNAVAELDGLYLDIEQKIDALLHTSHAVATTDALQEECKDYLKMLHSIVNGEWSTEVNVEDDKVLFSHSDALIVRLIGCIERSFVLPAVDAGNHVHSNSIPGVDVSLLAISLSVLFSMVKRSEVSAALTEHTLFVVFHECLLRICDTRITSLATLHDATTTNESKETAQQIARALNNIVLKVGMNGTAGPVLLAMLRVMFCCIPVAELPHYPDHKPLPTSSTKPASRLVIQILSEHGNKSSPYSEPEVQLVPLLQAIHLFFTRHPTSTSNDTPFRTVKTVLNEIVLVKGGNYVLSVLYTTTIPHTAFIYLLTCRLGNVTMKPATSAEPHASPAPSHGSTPVAASPVPATLSAADTNAIHAAIVACIDDITSSRDKLAAIKQLHKIKAANPSIDINTYLLKISTAFRRYVLNTLAKLDGENNTAEINTSSAAPAAVTPTKALLSSIGSPAKPSVSPVGAVTGYAVDTPAAHEYASARSTPHTASSVHTTNSLDYSPASQATPSNSHTPHASAYAVADPANEAMRILEGIKARPNQIASEAPGGIDAAHRSYSLASPKGNAGSVSPTTPTGSSIGTSERELTAGKHKRFAYNPETKRMEIVMVSLDASPNNSPTHLSMALAGENSPFARRNDIIRNSLSSLTASLDHLPRSTSGEFRSTTTGVAIDEENLEARIQKLLSPKGNRVPDL